MTAGTARGGQPPNVVKVRLSGAATLAGQAEFQTRFLPLYIAQMAAEAKGCDHGKQAERAAW